jgi:hypothetical protein
MGLPDQVRRLFGLPDIGALQLPLDASSVATLSLGLRDLAPGERGWITFEDYGRLFEKEKPRTDRFWRIGATPPGPTWWITNARLDAWGRSFEGRAEWTWTSPSAMALEALASKHGCAPLRVPVESRFYFTKD